MLPFISMRLFDQHKNERQIDELIVFLKKYRDACDEIWFATDYGYPSLETHAESARLMTAAASRVRELGIAASIQISNSIGHGEYLKALDFTGKTWQGMVGYDGTIAGYCSCPRDSTFHEYLSKMTELYASWKPDTIWADDDLRMFNHKPVDWGCFCSRCLQEFNENYGCSFSCELLVKAISHSEGNVWRTKWIEFNRQSLSLVTRVIAEAVKSVSPDSSLGYQHAGLERSLYTGPDHHEVYDIMYGISRKKPLSRPGGGFYTDHSPRGMIDKALCINLQNMRLPEYVESTRPEIENFTHTAMGKTPQGTVLESTLDLAYGCNALSYAIFMVPHENLEWHGQTMEYISNWRPFWEKYLDHNRGTQPGGLKIAFSKNHAAQKLQENDSPFAWTNLNLGSLYYMTTMGLPISWSGNDDAPVILHPNASDGYSAKELARLFSNRVVTDGETIRKLQERGLGHLTGVTAEPIEACDGSELLSDHKLNGSFSGSIWLQYQFSPSFSAYKLFSTDTDHQVLGEYIRLDGKTTGTATMLTKTPGGGKLAVFGYNFWEHIVSSARRHQIIQAVDWVSGCRQPVIIETASQVVAVPRADDSGKPASVMIFNVSIDKTPKLKLRLRGCKGRKAFWVQPFGEEIVLAAGNENDELLLSLKPIDAWSVGYIKLV